MNKTRPILNFLFIVAAFFTASYSSNAQTPSWEWAVNSIGGNLSGARCVATDNNGNIYSAGSYINPGLLFGNQTITNLSNTNSSDAYIAKHNSNGEIVWLKNIGGINDEEINDIEVDSNNNLYIIGNFESPTLTFGNTTLVNTAYEDVFIAKFDSNGTPLWAKAITGQKYDYGFALTVDSSNNVYVGGNFFSDTIDVSGITLTNVEAGLAAIDHDVFFAKYDTDGTILWAKNAGGTSYEQFKSLKTDANGNLYITGYFYSPSITFGTTTLNNTNNYGDIFLVKYNASGVFQWAKRAGGDNYDYVRDMDIDGNGDIYLAGHFESTTLTFGAFPLNKTGDTNVFLAKYNSSGTVLWAKKAGTTLSSIATGVATDSNNNVYITGGFNSTITFGTLPSHTTQGDRDIYVCKYDTNGEAIWSKANGGSGYELTIDIDSNQNNDLFITGSAGASQISFDNTTLTPSSGTYIVAKIPGTVLGTEDFKTEQFSIFPNPVKNHLFLNKADSFNGSNYYIVDLNGRTVLNGKISENNTVDTSSLETGIYAIRIDNGVTKKFIKE